MSSRSNVTPVMCLICVHKYVLEYMSMHICNMYGHDSAPAGFIFSKSYLTPVICMTYL